MLSSLNVGLLAVAFLWHPAEIQAEVKYDARVPQLAFAAQELERALGAAEKSNVSVSLMVKPDPAQPEGFRIQIMAPGKIEVIGTDLNGAMYGGLELADRVDLGLPLENQLGSPFVGKRGIKFNLPWDARSPSYDDTGFSAQMNIETMYDLAFWTAFIDDMARYRYNVLSLWSTAPYANLVKLEEYPEAVLEDVYRMKDGLLQPRQPRDLFKTFDKDKNGAINEADGVIERVMKLSMDEKTAHWQKVFQHAADRGIEIYLFSWNVFTHGATGKYGITQDQTNPKTIKYMRTLVRETLLAYPQIAGVGVCSGENDRRELDDTPDSTEHYIFKTYGRAIMDVKEQFPDRKIRFIHRRHGSDPDRVREAFRDYTGGELETSVKYAVAHIYSSRRPQEWEKRIIGEGWNEDFKVWLNLRNDDIFMHRWGSPDFVREFIKWMPHDDSPGFMMGSDGYVWARDFAAKNPQLHGQMEIDKHWYKFRLWGQLAYDNERGDDYWQAVLAHRFPNVDAALLHDTWETVSEIIPQLNRSAWSGTDAGFAAEGVMSWLSPASDGFLTLDDYYFDRPPMALNRIENGPDQQCISVTDWAKAKLSGNDETLNGLTPLEVADNLDRFAHAADRALPRLRSQIDGNIELRETLFDIESMAHLGRYYADKLRGAAKLALFRATDGEDRTAHRESVTHLEEAVHHWEEYSRVLEPRYIPTLMARTYQMDWMKTLRYVKAEVETVRQEGDFPEVAFDGLNDGDRLPLGSDLRVEVTAFDRDGIETIKLYVNGLLLTPETTGKSYVWSASSDEILRNLEEGFYQVEAVAIDRKGISGRATATIRVGSPKLNKANDWTQNIHRVLLSDGEIWKVDIGQEIVILLERLECTLTFGADGKIILRDDLTNVITFRANAHTKAGRHHAVFEKGKLTTYNQWPEDEKVFQIWQSFSSQKIQQKGPFKLGITQGKRIVCFTEENGSTEIVWSYKPVNW
ncbi:MAG: hypothetical protein SynsKO_16670 [Synoicihabitans sp.]